MKRPDHDCKDALHAILAAMIALCLFIAPLHAAAETPPSKDPTLDDLLNIPVAPGKPADAKPKSAPDQSMPPEGITEGTHTTGEPFEAAIAEMKQAAGLLESHDPTINTQRIQQRVIRRLDQLIADARKQQQKNKPKPGSRQQDQGEQGNEPQQSQAKAQGEKSKQASDSSNNSTNQQKAEDARPKDSIMAEKLAEWGNLPPRLRDQLLQGMDDRYSQVYREMTEKYYRRLAEQNK